MDEVQGGAQWGIRLVSPAQGILQAPHPAGRSGWQTQRPHPAWTGHLAWKRKLCSAPRFAQNPRVSSWPWAKPTSLQIIGSETDREGDSLKSCQCQEPNPHATSPAQPLAFF